MKTADKRTSTARRLLVALLAVVAATLAAIAPASGQQPPPSNGGETGGGDAANGGFSIVNSWALSPGAGTPETAGRSNLSYELAPGTEADDIVTLYNLSNVALTFRVYATDGFNASDGTFSLLAGDQKPSDVGTWVSFPSEGVSLEAGHQATMPIKIRVPADARPGDHVGAVLASSAVPGTAPDGRVVNLDRRTGTRIYVRVAGPLEYKLSVENLSVTYKTALNPLGGTADVHYKLVNRGNARVAGTQQIELSGPFGVFGTSSRKEDVPELLPGQSMDVARSIDHVTASGLLTAHVTLDPKAVGTDDKQLASSGSGAFTFAVPLVIVALLVIWLLLRFARRRYNEHAEAGPTIASRERTRELV